MMAALVVCSRAGTDGAMSLFYEQQLTTGSLDSWPHKQPIVTPIAITNPACSDAS